MVFSAGSVIDGNVSAVWWAVPGQVSKGLRGWVVILAVRPLLLSVVHLEVEKVPEGDS